MRKRAFQLKYALALGLRPSSLDPQTHEVLMVQCAFCVAFGREPRAEQDPEATDAADAPADADAAEHEQDEEGEAAPVRRARRARTSNIRSWAPPMRPDNIRLHMRAQHPARFSAYAALVTRAKEDGSFQVAAALGVGTLFPALATGDPAAPAVSLLVTGAARDMLAYFGDVLAMPALPLPAAAIEIPAPLGAPSSEDAPLAARSRDAAKASARPLLVKRLTAPAVVTELVDSLVCLSDTSLTPETGVEDDDLEFELASSPSVLAKRRRLLQGGRESPPTSLDAFARADGDVVESNERVTIRRVASEEAAAAAVGPGGARSSRAGRDRLELDVKNGDELAKTQRLLALGLSFEQAAQTMALMDPLSAASPPLSAATVASLARVSVASGLDLVADLMRRSWTFALVLHVCDRARLEPSSTAAPAAASYRAVDVCVRLPTAGNDGSNDALSFHVVALPLLPFEHSLERALATITRFLDVLDANWTRKLMGCSITGSDAADADDGGLSTAAVAATGGLSASTLAQHVAQHVLSRTAAPVSVFYHVWQPAQRLTDVMQRALGEMKGAIIVNGVRVDTGFSRSLGSVTAFLRGQEAWLRAHGRCPLVDVRCPWSVLAAVEWLLARRHAIDELYASTPQLRSTVYPNAIFWLVLFMVADVLTMFAHARRQLEAFPVPSSRESRRILADCARLLMDKTGVARVDAPRGGGGGSSSSIGSAVDDVEGCDYVFGDNVSRLGRFEWQREPHLVRYVRSLNLSSRRLYSDTSAANQGRAEFGITCFTLRVLHAVDLLAHRDTESEDQGGADGDGHGARAARAVTTEAPPTLPLHFVDLDRSRAVDLIDQHSARLEKAFGSRFLDRISSDMERLRTLVGTATGAQASPFRLQLEAAQARSFHDAWLALVPHGMASLRRFAAGLASVLPRVDGFGAPPLALHFPASDEDQFRANFADLAIEARLHCAQARRLLADAHTMRLAGR